MTELELGWLAGLLEGEGSFLAGPPSQPRIPLITLQMCDEDIVHRAAEIFHTSVYTCRPLKEHHKISFRTHCRGKPAVEWMQKLRPLMGARRQGQIDRACASYAPSKCRRLTATERTDMRMRREGGQRVEDIAALYGVHNRTVYEHTVMNPRSGLVQR